MGYVGNEPSTNYTSFAQQTITGNGGTSYTLSHSVADGKEILLYINNIKQEEGSGKAYQATGTALTLSEAISSTDECYCVFLGKAIQTTVPPDGSVTTAKLASSAVNLTTKVTGALPVANGGTAITSGFINGGMTVGTATTLSSVASVTFDNIPSTAQQIRFAFHAVTPGNTEIEIRVGHSSAFINSSDYFNHVSYYENGDTATVAYENNTKWRTTGWSHANNTYYGYYDLWKNTISGTNYVYQDSGFMNTGFTSYSPLKLSGFANLGSNVLSKVIFMTGSGGNFSEGFITMTYI